MTQDEIVQLAKDAGLRIDVRGTYFFVGFGELSDLLDSAIAKEREACAKVCDEDGAQAMDFTYSSTLVGGYFAEIIRARGEA